MNCPICNAPVIEGAAFCGNCGSPISTVQSEQSSQHPSWTGGQQALFGQASPSDGQPIQQAVDASAAGADAIGGKVPKKPLIIGGAAIVVVVLAIALIPAFMGGGSSSQVSMYVTDTLESALRATGVWDSLDSGANVTGRMDVVVRDLGFSIEDGGHVSCACTVENPNDEFIPQSVEVAFAGYDSAGKMVFQESTYLSYVLPNQITGAAVSSYKDVDGLESIECSVNVPDGSWVHVRNFPVDEAKGMFVFADVAERTDEYGMLTIGGAVQNNTDSSFRGVQVTGILRNSAGEVVGGVNGYTSGSLSTPGATSLFELGFYSDTPAFSTCTLYAMPS